MTFNVTNRKVHYWASFAVSLPLVVIITTGLLLQLKKHWSFVQPHEQSGSSTEPAIDLEGLLRAVQSVPELGVTGWSDVNRIDVRPGRGLAKVWLYSGYEVQVDLDSGHVLQTAFRRSDLIEELHDGSFFAGDWTKLGVFLPAGVVLLLLWLSGLWMFAVPVLARRRMRRARVGRDP